MTRETFLFLLALFFCIVLFYGCWQTFRSASKPTSHPTSKPTSHPASHPASSPVKILTVQHRTGSILDASVDPRISGCFSEVFVDHFPETAQEKINWWLENQNMLKEAHNIPNPDSEGHFVVTFWLLHGGSRADEGEYSQESSKDEPLVSSYNMEVEPVFGVAPKTPGNGLVLMVYDDNDTDYHLDNNGKITKINIDE
ncbi:DUF943 family protein [Enterobacteriaceae bacterium ESL0689]|nr:DUF943 family protein [Enterobacteriaceae bacterium ESL0689]